MILLLTSSLLFWYQNKRPKNALKMGENEQFSPSKETAEIDTKTLPEDSILRDFSDFDNAFEFRATYPMKWRIEYIEDSSAINLYKPAENGLSSLDQSQIFVKFFRAGDFLTLSSVEVLKKEPGELNGHPSVLYEIEKKPQAENFANQPAWRNERHFVLDVRNSSSNPSTFFVIAKNPLLSQDEFSNFTNSMFFYNDQKTIFPPIADWQTRVTKKPFSTEVSPQNSPVENERFSGFHTGTDFEIEPNELEEDIPVHAVCYGEIIQKGIASGYGGVIVQKCHLNQQPTTVVYGHLSFSAEFSREEGFYLTPGQLLATLADEKSEQSGDERKHLHLSIHKGETIDLRGYVQDRAELENWLDPEEFLRQQ